MSRRCLSDVCCRQKLMRVTSTRDFAILKLEKLCTTLTSLADEAKVNVPSDIFEALQILGPYAERKLHGAAKAQGRKESIKR